MTSGLTFTIDQKSLALVIDQSTNRPIGTAFIFIQPHWAVTAKHVVLHNDGTPREIKLQFLPGANFSARVLFAHPSIDLAVLIVAESPCEYPLFPAHHGFAGVNGLVVAGYAPSLTVGNSLSIFVNHVPSSQIELRERTDENEEVVVFPSNFTESGHSGGPVFGLGGGVVGVVIEHSETGTTRATSLSALVRRLGFSNVQGQ